MSTNPNYTFTLNVSQRAYQNKLPDNMVGTITFTTQTLSVNDLADKIKKGYAFCYNFKKNTDILTMREKTIAGFQCTSIIFFDFDHMTISMKDFIDGLNYKPTLAYTSYSNAPSNNDYRYRLIYAFSDTIKTVALFNKLYLGVAIANGFEKSLDKRVVNQCYYGSREDCEIYCPSEDLLVVYSPDDFISTGFPIENEDYTSYYYSNSSFPNQSKESEDVIHLSSEMETVPELSDEFMIDLELMGHVSFIDKYMPLYESGYVKSLSTELIMNDDGSCFFFPSDYLEIWRGREWYMSGKYSRIKIKDGEKRRKKLYITAKIMLHNMPDMSLEQLVYNLVRERDEYYCNKDGQLRESVLIDIAMNAFKYRDIPIQSKNKKKYKVNKDYWAEYGIKPNEAKNVIRGKLHEEEVLAVYDFSKSVKENLENLKALGIKAGKSYLYDLVKKYPNGGRPLHVN